MMGKRRTDKLHKMKLRHRLRTLFFKSKFDAEMAEEMRHHLEEQAERHVEAGMSPAEARFAAQREFGNVGAIQQQAREVRPGIWWEQFGKDLGFTIRSLWRARGFSVTVIGTLVLGIGVATMVFKLVAPALLLPYSFPHSEELFLVGQRDQGGQDKILRPFIFGVQFQAYRDQTSVFRGYAVLHMDLVNVVIAHEPSMVSLYQISPDFFPTLGIQAALGRTFLPEEFSEDRRRVVVISDVFWRTRFNADPNVLGQTLIIDRDPCTIVGVLRPGQMWPVYFDHGEIFQPMAPLRVDPANPHTGALFVLGRIQPGISREQACDALARTVLPELSPTAARFFERQRPDLVSLRDLRIPDKHTGVLVAAGLLLYLTAGLNAVNLMLVRLLGRRQELSIRLALGGSRGRIMRLLALESAGLALLAGIVVMVAAKWLFPSLLFLITRQESAGSPLLNWSVFGCIAGLSILASLGVAILPAIRLAKANLQPALKSGGSGGGESRGLARLRGTLVILQSALAVILLSGAGLMIRSFEKIHATDLGINPVGLFKVRLIFPAGPAPDQNARLQLFDRLRVHLGVLPGVKGVTFGEDTVLTGGFWGREQVELSDGTYLPTTGSFVAADFYRVAGLTLRKGRWFSEDRSQNEVVVSETMAKALYGARDPIEKTFKLKAYPNLTYRVVGVARDVRESVRSPSGMRFYAPCWWYPPLISTLVLRLEREPGPEFAGLVRHAIYEFDPGLLAYDVTSFSEVVENSLWSELFAYKILKVLAAIALGLAMVGIFATVAYTVNCKQREFGVRLALGARPVDLHRLVLRRSLLLAVVGVAIGLGAASGLTRYMQSLLYETTPFDPLVHGMVAVLLLAAAVLACWLPARRAAKVDPIVALRAE
jgi:predicted permease